MNRILLVAIIAILLPGCQKGKLKPEKLATYRLVRVIQKTVKGKIINDYSFDYDDSNRLITSKETAGTDLKIYSDYFYNDTDSSLVKKIESYNDNGNITVTTSVINYVDNIPVSASVNQSPGSFNHTTLFTIENDKVVSARISGTDLVDSVVYEGDNIVQRFQTADSKENYTYGTRRGFFNFNFKWFLSDITPLQFANEVVSYRLEDPGVASINITYGNYVYNIAGYPTSCQIFDVPSATAVGTIEFLYEKAK